MTAGQDITQPGGSLPQRLARARQQARRALWVEQLWPLMLPTADAAMGVALLGLGRLPQHMPDSLHALLLAGIAGGTAYATWRQWRGIHAPTASETDRRVEQASGLTGQPLRTLHDRPANTLTPEITYLWQVHLHRTTAALGRLRGGWPRPRLKGATGWAATPVLAVLLAGGMMWTGDHAASRVTAAFLPGMDDADTPAPQINAWITMPDYAPGAPVFLDATHTSATVPAGARLAITLNGLNGRPALRMRASGPQPAIGPHDFHALGNASWNAQATLLASGTLRLRGRGRTLGQWTLHVTPNPAPEVAWGKDPGSHEGEWRTRLPYHVAQPYGIASMHAELVMPDSPRDVLTVPIPLNGHPSVADDVATPDLSQNPWAGEDVTARLVASSTSGMTATSAPIRLRMGARPFNNPLAKAVLDIRKRVALHRENRAQAARELLALGQADTMLTHHVGLLLALTSVAAVLGDADDVTDDYAITQATGRLWFLALDIEHNRRDIDNEQADFGVQAAQDAVREQLEHMREMGPKGQGPEQQAELQHRMQALKDAISRKMQALAQQAMRDHSAIPAIPEMTSRGEQNMAQMMQQLQDDAANGRDADAMQKLQQMEDMANGIRNATPQDMMQLAQQMQARQQARELRRALRDLVSRQSRLLDHAQSRMDQTQRQQERDAASRQTDMDEDGGDLSSMSTADLLRQLGITPSGSAPQPQAGATPPPESMTPEAHTAQQHADRAVQHALSRALHELQREFKQASGKDMPALDKAQTDMKAVRAALGAGKDPDAAAAEKKVLADLQQGDQQMRQSMRSQNAHGGMTVFLPMLSQDNGKGSHGSGGNQPGGQDDDDDTDQQAEGKGDRDPLGRKTGGTHAGMDNDTHVPDNASRERAREIEQELRRRDADRTRPPEELEYLDRLLRAF
ncbi:DUF4175 domain-containing protein [Komagataeibacter europaeus]|uniref:DUF4175 domain-containing protein n=1 Tax=Komagataeibacter europaeus TaxID=33995 RepID=UPI000311B89B|nr:DUF4175 family protein [Komagataeibacter europaeus]GBQ40578.1 hypothetical protein AA18890_0850 [Komagataeibacter europaeus LMG 18890]